MESIKLAACLVLVWSCYLSVFCTAHEPLRRQSKTASSGISKAADLICPIDSLYYLSERRGPNHVSGVGLVMVCDAKPICGLPTICLFSEKTICSAQFEYLAGVVVQSNAKDHVEYCCLTTAAANPTAREICETVLVPDRTIYANGTSANRYKKDANLNVALAKLRVGYLKKKAPTGTEIVKNIRPTLERQHSQPVVPSVGSVGPAAVVVDLSNGAAADTVSRNQNGEEENGGLSEVNPGVVGPIDIKKCFPGDAEVQTRRGYVHMRDLQYGDDIKVFNAFEPLEWFIHRDSATVTDFVEITLINGKSLTLSERHLLPITDCTDQSDMNSLIDHKSRYAYRAAPGHCVIVVSNATTVELVMIARVQMVKKQGLYSPITRSGTIVVNGIMTSCFSHVENHVMLRNVFKRYFLYRDWLSSLFDASVDDKPGLGLPLLIRVAAWIMPVLSISA